MAAAAGETPESKEPFRPRLAGWSTEVEMLAAVFDSVQSLAQALAGGEPFRYPRPETAMERLRARRKKQVDDLIENSLMAWFAPHLGNGNGGG